MLPNRRTKPMSLSLIFFFLFFFTLFFIPFLYFSAGDDQIYDSATNGNHRTDIKPSNKPLPSKKSHKVKKKKHYTQCVLSDIKDSSDARIPASPLQLSGCGVLQITFLAFKVTATTFTLRYLFTALCSVSPHLAGLSGDTRQLWWSIKSGLGLKELMRGCVGWFSFMQFLISISQGSKCWREFILS